MTTKTKQGKQPDLEAKVRDLEHEVKQYKLRVSEMREEIDDLRARNQTLRDNAQIWHDQFESWKEVFGMQLDDDGVWKFKDEADEWRAKYEALAQEHNALYRDYKAFIYARAADGTLRGRGRAINADETQRRIVFESYEEGRSLRECADDAGVSLQTVRTLIGKINGTDRTSVAMSKRLAKHGKVKVDRAEIACWKRNKRVRDGLPKRLHELDKQTTELLNVKA